MSIFMDSCSKGVEVQWEIAGESLPAVTSKL